VGAFAASTSAASHSEIAAAAGGVGAQAAGGQYSTTASVATAT
jgi:hypothetical protein